MYLFAELNKFIGTYQLNPTIMFVTILVNRDMLLL